jgi:copper oxidase (laccase) domain-containing protein
VALLQPVFVERTNRTLSIHLIGDEPRYKDTIEAENIVFDVTGSRSNKTCLLLGVPTRDIGGCQTVRLPDFNEPIFADGVVIDGDDTAVVLQTADCLTVVLYDCEQCRYVVLHAGRPALTPAMPEIDVCTNNIIETGLHMLRAEEPAHVSAYILGGICGQCFKHEQPEARPHIEPFMRFHRDCVHPPVILDETLGTLDMRQLVRHQLRYHGLPQGNIFIDHTCTFESNWLSSHRRGDTNRNTVVVTLT